MIHKSSDSRQVVAGEGVSLVEQRVAAFEGRSVRLAQQQVQAAREAGEAYEEHPYAGYYVDAAL